MDDSVRNVRSIAWFNKQPAVLIQITKQGDANVIDTVDRVQALIPELKQWIPAGIEILDPGRSHHDHSRQRPGHAADAAGDRFLVMVVVFMFLRRLAPTVAAGVSVPLALAGTCAGMWLAGFSIDNLSLMALAISVGFVVDDAIVMIENMYRNLEQGMQPYQAALQGARQIGFTVLSISLSLIAAFTPLIFMDGIVGRLLREFSLTLTFAIANELSGWIDANGGGSGMTGSGLVMISSAPVDVVLQSLGNTQAAASGQGNVYLVGSIGGASGVGMPQILSGTSVTWSADDGG